VYYFGGTGGGVWKTTDAAHSWNPTTDGQLGTGSVGAVAVAESDPNVVYAGWARAACAATSRTATASTARRRGRTWTHLGLRETEQIGRVRVHPRTRPRLRRGHRPHVRPEQRARRLPLEGRRRTWEQGPVRRREHGRSDLAMDPDQPARAVRGLLAGAALPVGLRQRRAWQLAVEVDRRRRQLEEADGRGLPSKGPWGRIGVAVSPARGDRVWAVIEAEDGGVFRSDNGGKSWRRTNEDRRLRQRAWYYTHVFADPKDAEVVYVLNVQFFRSQDGGKTFRPHPRPARRQPRPVDRPGGPPGA
jgi:hypothetical protein